MIVKRIASLASAVAVLVLVQVGAPVQSAEGYCPPGAKFCPSPAPDNYFQSQLREGEQLILVAPGGDFANIPASGQVAFAPPANLFTAQPSPAPMPAGGGYAGGYAAAPIAPVASHADPSDGLRGFVPPRPGSGPASYANYSGYEAPPPAMSRIPASAPASLPVPAPPTAGAFSAPAQSFSPSFAPKPIPVQARRPRPEAAQMASAPAPERHPYQNPPADQKKRRADQLSEVANETSRRAEKIDLKPRPENRKPWWKGGFLFWNRKSDASRQKKSRADIQAERREAKAAAQKAKEGANRANY
jgi:hypothetical protein